MKISASCTANTAAYKQTSFNTISVNSFEELSRWITFRCWSPIVWKNGTRLAKNFNCSEICVLDFDDPGYSLAQCCKDFCDTQHVIGTTRSHQKEKNGIVCDRFRLAIPFDRSIDDQLEYEYNLRQITSRYPADPACVDGARFYYPCQEIVSIQPEGFVQDVLSVPGDLEKTKYFETLAADYKYRRECLGRLPPMWVTATLRVGVPVGQRNKTCFKVAIALAKLCYSELEIIQIIENSALNGQADFGTAEQRRAIASGIKYAMRDENQSHGCP